MEAGVLHADGPAWHYSAGADGIYFFNYFDDPGWRKPETQYWKDFDQPLETMGVWWGNQLKWLKFIGHPDAVLAAPRDHMLTYRDIVPLWEDVRPEEKCFDCASNKGYDPTKAEEQS